MNRNCKENTIQQESVYELLDLDEQFIVIWALCISVYDFNYDYSLHTRPNLIIGKINNVYKHWDAQKFKNEAPRIYSVKIAKLR